jgi:CIC family chloride channel protein
MPVGVAAGIAAAFNAPIAAVTFTIEEVVGTLDHSVLSGVVVAAAIAAVIERAVLGGHPIITVGAEYGLHDPWSLVFYVVLGVLAAIAGVAFTDGLLKLRGAWKNTRAVPVWAQPAVGGLATGVLMVVALGALHVGGINGGGYETLGLALDGNLGLKVLLALFALKALATIASYSSGGVGGIFAPTLFMGAMLGGAVGYLDVAVFDHGTDQLGAFALVGMGALFAGVIRAPITAVLIIFEMTGSYGLVLPLMVASTVAYAIARRWRPTSIYEALLNQDGVFLPARGRRPHPLENLQVADAMTAEVVAASSQTTVAEAARMFDAGGFALLPVVDERRCVTAAVHARQVRGAVAAGALRTPLLELAQPVQTIHADALLLDAVVRMTRLGVRQLVVTDGNAHERLVGILSMTDLVRAHARTARAEDTAQHAAVADDDATDDGAPPRSSPHDLRAGGIMVAAPVVPVDAALHALIDHALASSCHVVVVAHADRAPGLITLDRLRPFLRDEDLQKMLRAADLERPAPCLAAGAPLMEVVRALVDGDAPAVVVVDGDGRTPRGVVTREEVSAVLLDWYARGNGGASDRPSNGPADPGRGGDIA